MESVIRGYHEYRSTWEAAYGELLSCQRETGNSYDSFAVGVMKNGSIVGHIPRKLSAVCAMFLQQGGFILCQVSGNRQYSRDLPQGGLEIPCILTFSGEEKGVTKVKDLVQKIATFSLKPASSTTPILHASAENLPAGKRLKVEHLEDDSTSIVIDSYDDVDTNVDALQWLRVGSITLKYTDKDTILNGDYLTDNHINVSQKVLATQFPALTGLDLTFKLCFHGKWRDDYVQMLHCRGCHWITVSTIGCANGVINVYDSLYEDVDFDTHKSIREVFSESNITFHLPKVQKQKGAHDCGLFAIAFATKLCFSQDPIGVSATEFSQDALRGHFISCLENSYFMNFP